MRDYIFNSIGLDTAITAFEELSRKLAESANGNLPAFLQRFQAGAGDP